MALPLLFRACAQITHSVLPGGGVVWGVRKGVYQPATGGMEGLPVRTPPACSAQPLSTPCPVFTHCATTCNVHRSVSQRPSCLAGALVRTVSTRSITLPSLPRSSILRYRLGAAIKLSLLGLSCAACLGPPLQFALFITRHSATVGPQGGGVAGILEGQQCKRRQDLPLLGSAADVQRLLQAPAGLSGMGLPCAGLNLRSAAVRAVRAVAALAALIAPASALSWQRFDPLN